MMQHEAEDAQKFITGTLSIGYKHAFVLLDLGATHSFISSMFTTNTDRKVE